MARLGLGLERGELEIDNAIWENIWEVPNPEGHSNDGHIVALKNSSILSSTYRTRQRLLRDVYTLLRRQGHGGKQDAKSSKIIVCGNRKGPKSRRKKMRVGVVLPTVAPGTASQVEVG